MKPRITTALLSSLLGFCYNHYPKGLFQIHTTHTMMSSGTKSPARTMTKATMAGFLSCVGNCSPLYYLQHLPLLQTLGMWCWVVQACFLYPWSMSACPECISDQQLLPRVHKANFMPTSECLNVKSTVCYLIRQLLLTWYIYSESYEYYLYFYQHFHFTPRHLKVKFAFSGLIRQLPWTWPIHSEHYEYCPFSSQVSFLTVVNFITKMRT
jgi:hypothetical protein